ncbi:MAG: galactokinase [Cytophagia bacterium]|nr:galactokinase [Cytophagia bacterium]
MDRRKIIETFRNKFQGEPRVFRSPGRINIIGEHTDYNNGFVLPAAVDKEIILLMTPNDSDSFNIYSIDQDESVNFSLTNYESVKTEWAKYLIGVIDQILKAGHQIRGFDCVFGGNIPIGAGLSSSAALECATLFGISECFNLNLEKRQIAQMAQKAENEYVGVNCGIMDQFASVFSKKSHALKIDCRDLTYESFEIKFGNYTLMLVDSMVKHNLASSEYNIRRQECEAAVKAISANYPEIKSLRDASIDQLTEVRNLISDKIFNRAKYIIQEISRVNQACDAIKQNDLVELGQLLYATHYGLQHEFEISCEELDFLVDFTRDKSYILGSRMMGGGFGGCTINLIDSDYQEEFAKEVSEAYEKHFGKAPGIYFVKTANGSSEIKELQLANE